MLGLGATHANRRIGTRSAFPMRKLARKTRTQGVTCTLANQNQMNHQMNTCTEHHLSTGTGMKPEI